VRICFLKNWNSKFVFENFFGFVGVRKSKRGGRTKHQLIFGADVQR